MSLQHDIAARYLEPIYDANLMETEDIELAKEVINKVLDAAVEAGNFLPYPAPIEGAQTAYNNAIKDYQEEINELRQEK